MSDELQRLATGNVCTIGCWRRASLEMISHRHPHLLRCMRERTCSVPRQDISDCFWGRLGVVISGFFRSRVSSSIRILWHFRINFRIVHTFQDTYVCARVWHSYRPVSWRGGRVGFYY